MRIPEDSALENILMIGPPFVPIVGALAAGAYFGYCNAQGAPVENAGWYLAGVPVVSGFAFTPMARKGSEIGIVGTIFRAMSVVGSAVSGPMGYGLGYVAGRLSQ